MDCIYIPVHGNVFIHGTSNPWRYKIQEISVWCQRSVWTGLRWNSQLSILHSLPAQDSESLQRLWCWAAFSEWWWKRWPHSVPGHTKLVQPFFCWDHQFFLEVTYRVKITNIFDGSNIFNNFRQPVAEDGESEIMQASDEEESPKANPLPECAVTVVGVPRSFFDFKNCIQKSHMEVQ